MAVVEDPFAKLRSAAAVGSNPEEVKRRMQEQQLIARQHVLQQQAASAIAAASKTQREVYVGGLVPGVVTEQMLRELFRTTLTSTFPEKCKGGIDPVISINMSPEGKFCFVELMSAEMATACLQLSGQVPLMGSMLTIGRPTGYVDPEKANNAANAAADALAKFQAESQSERLASGAATAESLRQEDSTFLCVSGMVNAEVLEKNEIYNEVIDDIRQELEKHGDVLRVCIPRPSDPSKAGDLLGSGPYGKVFIQYLKVDGSKSAKEAMNGRFFDQRPIEVSFMQPQDFLDAIKQPEPEPEHSNPE